MRSIILWLLLVATTAQAQKKIAITVDDLPTVSRVYRSPTSQRQLTQALLANFKKFHVPAIGFVIGHFLQTNAQPDSGQLALLKLWQQAGLELGNHTFAHNDYNLVSFEQLKADVIAGEGLTKKLAKANGQPFRYFRHPYLRRGDTKAKKDSLEAFLRERGYREAPVTVDNSDWLFSQAYDHALLQHNTSQASEVGRNYLTHMADYVAYYEAQSDSLFGRQIPQILLMHANTINADYSEKLLSLLKERGYTFISLDEALLDPAYQSRDEYAGKGGISWLHRWALTRGKKGTFFKGEPNIPPFIEALANSKP